MPTFEHEIGANVFVDVAGKVVARHESERGLKYIIAPNDKRLPVVHAHPDMVFADDDAEVVSNVIAFPRPVDEVA